MRQHKQQDVSRVADPVTREILRRITTDLADISTQVGTLSSGTGGGGSSGSGFAPDDALYVLTSADASLTNGKVLVTTTPITGSVGAGTVTIAAPTAVTSAASLTDDAIVVGAGGAQGCETRGIGIDSSNFRLRETGGEWIGMASTTAKTSQTSQTANTSEQTLHSEALLSGILDVAGRNLHVRAWGTMSYNSSMSPTTLTLAFKYGSTAVWSTDITFGTPAGSVLQHWCFLLDVITVSSGNARAFGMFIYGNVTGGAGGALGVEGSEIAVASAPTTSGAVSASLTHDWSVTDANMTMTCEMCSFELGGLTA